MLPMEQADETTLNDADAMEAVRGRLQELLEILQPTGECCLIHCAAGVHRTGIIAYSLIRLGNSYFGKTKEDAYRALMSLRQDTHFGVGEWRIDLAEENIVKPILK